MNDCKFCDDGRCLLCQMAAPVECGASSSHGVLVDRNSGTLGNGNHRKGATPELGRGLTSGFDRRSREPMPRPAGKLCPICKLTFRDLYHHYNKRHPGKAVPR